MLVDKRIETLSNNLVNYSCELKAGENILIEAKGCDYQLVCSLIKEVYKVGAKPFVTILDNKITRELMLGITPEQVDLMREFDEPKMKKMDAYIGIRGGNNCYEMCDVPSEKTKMYSIGYSEPVHSKIRVDQTKWVILRYPTEGMSQMSNMSTEAFEDMFFKVCNLDYKKMDTAMTPLVELMNRTDKVRIVAKDTDLSFSIKGINAIKCSGLRNIPDGEVYTAPVKDSVNGVISYNVPSVENGFKFENVQLTFKDGKIVKATSNDNKLINEIFDTDEGARFVGEFALGVNPYITKGIGDILFDEKISGSIHFTPGASYTDAFNGNKSAVHWDLVLIQTKEYGGGEIYFDGKLIRKDGIFVLPELEVLNPNNLK
ncbi:MAG: aminopeptidase [Clostridia bacterium]